MSKRSAWQDISSAPKDGTRILTWNGVDVRESMWIGDKDDHGRFGWCYADFTTGGIMFIMNNVFPEDEQPTQWRHLPAPPTAKATGE